MSNRSVSYRVEVRPAQHELAIEMLIKNPVTHGYLVVETPTWVPGDYDFRPYARDLFEISARETITGTPLFVKQTGWQSYHIENATGLVTINYRASSCCNDFAEVCGIVDSEYAILLGARYLRLVGWDGPIEVSYQLPDRWGSHHASGAEELGLSEWRYPSYEYLLDTPVVFGVFQKLQRNVRGTDFYFLYVDQTLGQSGREGAFADAVVSVAIKIHEIFGAFPFPDYTFVLSTNPNATWGLEHLSSSMCGIGPEVFIDGVQFAFGVKVCAHELFHAWNVRRVRPAPLKQLDLRDGSFTQGLWLGEGFTRYYEFLLCTRAGFYTPEQFFSSIVNYYTHLSSSPAYSRVSAVNSSYASYLNHSKYPGRCNNSIDYYDKGMLIAFGADASLRLLGAGLSLDTWFRSFCEKYVNSDIGYTVDDVASTFEIQHASLGNRIFREVTDVAGLQIELDLERIGFKVNKRSENYLGLMFNDSVGPKIYGVLDSSPAGESGIMPDDLITKVNGFPFNYKCLTWTARQTEPVTLEVCRGQRSLKFTINPELRETISHLTWEGSEIEAEMIRKWLCSDLFRPHAGHIVRIDFYENFHGVETVI